MTVKVPGSTDTHDAQRDGAPGSPLETPATASASSASPPVPRCVMADWIGELIPDAAVTSPAESSVEAAWPEHPFDSTGLGLWEAHLPTRSVRYSRALLEALGYAHGQLDPRLDAWRALIHPQDALRVDAAMTRHLTGQSSQFRIECRLRHARGHYVWMLVLGEISERDGEGRPLRMLCSHTDLSERRALESALGESEQKFRLLFETSPIGLALLDLTGRWLDANPALCSLLGYARDELLQRSFQEITHEDDLAADLDQAGRLLAGEIEGYCIEKRQLRCDGSVLRVSFCNHLLRDADGNPRGFLAQFQRLAGEDVVNPSDAGVEVAELTPEQAQALAVEPSAQARRLDAPADAIGLHVPSSRGQLGDVLEAEINLASRHGRHLALLLLELEPRGRDERAVQALESELDRRLRAVVRRSDLMARCAPHTFAFVLKQLESPEQALRVIEQLLAEVRQAGEQSSSASVDACLGASLYPQDGDSAVMLLSGADRALGQARDAGRNTFRFADGAFDALMADRSAALKLLRAALERREVRNSYRPVVALDDGAPRILEVVPVFLGEDTPPVALAELLPGSPQGELLQQVQRRVSEQVDQDLQELLARFGPGIPVAFRLHPLLLREANIDRTLRPIIALRRETGASVAVLIEEYLLASVGNNVYLHLRELREHGVDFVIDGFGGSVSNFHRMAELAPRWVVIEPRLAARHTDPSDLRMLRALIRIARCVDAQVAWPAGESLPPLRNHRLDIDAALVDEAWHPHDFDLRRGGALG